MQYNNQDIEDNLFLFTSDSVNLSENVRRTICKDMCPKEDDFNLKRVKLP